MILFCFFCVVFVSLSLRCRFVSLRSVPFRFVSFRARFVFVSFRFASFRFVSFRSVPFRFVSFRFVSFRSRLFIFYRFFFFVPFGLSLRFVSPMVLSRAVSPHSRSAVSIPPFSVRPVVSTGVFAHDGHRGVPPSGRLARVEGRYQEDVDHVRQRRGEYPVVIRSTF